MPTLFLIPTTLANNIEQSAILDYQKNLIKHIKYFIVENAKTGRKHLQQLNLEHKLHELSIKELNKNNVDIDLLVETLHQGFDLGLMSDCGMPAIADPGAQIVRYAHIHKFSVYPLVGPSSLLLALSASGVNGQQFTFNGYLPVNKIQLQQNLLYMQTQVMKENISQIFIETPFRNTQLLNTCLNILNDNLILCIAFNLMQNDQHIISQSIKSWKNSNNIPNIHKVEAVFILGMF